MSTSPALLPALVLLQPHGLKGAVKAKCLLENPDNIPTGTPLPTATGTTLTLVKFQQGAKGLLICYFKECTTPEAAAELRGTEILLPRDMLPQLDENELYAADLLDQTLFLENGQPAGTVTGLQETAAHTLLVLTQDDGREALIPFEEDFLTMAEDGSFYLTPLASLLLVL